MSDTESHYTPDDEVPLGPQEASDELQRADADGRVHGRLGAPDPLGSDDVAELVATEFPAEDDLTEEESALHFEP